MKNVDEKWMRYYSYMANEAGKTKCGEASISTKMIEFLKKEGLLNQQGNILDIGAGLGPYSLEFAKNCQQVEALDANEECLKYLSEKAKQLGVENVITKNVAWEQFVSNNKYNLVFSSMCPAINCVEEIERMEQISLDSCAIVTVMPGSTDVHRSNLMRQLPIHIPEGMVKNAKEIFEMLYCSGKMPNVKCFSEEIETRMNVSDAMTQYQIYFEIFDVPTAESKPVLEKYLKEHSVDDELISKDRMNYALIYWNK